MRKAKDKKQGIFISYRKNTGYMMAYMIYDRLSLEKGYECFFNTEPSGAQNIRQTLKQYMSACDIFILVLSRNALDRCSYPYDKLRQEIEVAKEMDLTFIPVMTDDFAWPEKMPEGLEYIQDLNAIVFNQEYFEAFFNRLYTFIETAQVKSTAGNDNQKTKPGSNGSVIYATKTKTILLWINLILLCFLLFVLSIGLYTGMTSRRSASAPAETVSKPETVIQETKEETTGEITKETTEESSATAALQKEVETENSSAEPAAVSQLYLPHKWGDYSPSGTAFIETLDGTRYTAIANSLILKTDEVESSGSEHLYKGLDDLVNDENPDESALISFAEMESVTRNGDMLDIVDIHGSTTSLELLEEGEILFIGEKDTGTPTSVLEKDIRSITFDRSSTPPTEIKYCTVRLDSGFYRSPAAFLWFNVNANEGYGLPSMYLTQDLRVYAGIPLPVRRIQVLIVTKNGNDAQYYVITEEDPHPEETEMTVKMTTGEEAYIITGHYFSIYTMAADGALRNPSVRELRSIEME